MLRLRMFGAVTVLFTLTACGSTTVAPTVISGQAAACVIEAFSRIEQDNLSKVVLADEGKSRADCEAVVAEDNARDAFGKAHPEVILESIPAGTPLCSEIVGGDRLTVWGDNAMARDLCHTFEFEAHPNT